MVGLVIPLHGSAGIFGPSCELCARLAAEEVNARDGVLDGELRLRVIDGSGSPARVADEVESLISRGEIDAVIGWHISAVRRVVGPRIARRVPYLYTALYEGGERNPWILMLGETPDAQLLPAMRWLAEERGVRRWCVVGNDYIWPRKTAAMARRFAERVDGEICEEVFVPLATERFAPTVGRVLASRAEGVIMLLVGQDAAAFNRAFADVGLDEACWRLSTLVDENTLLASGAEATRGLCAAAAYFESLVTPESLAFGARYAARYGPDAPALSSPGESCYEGVLLFAALAERTGSLDVDAMARAAATAEYEGPRGHVHVRDRHVKQRVYLAEADGFEFNVLARI